MTTTIKKRKQLGISVNHDKSSKLLQSFQPCPNNSTLALSPNPIRLSFIPRNLAVQQKSNVPDNGTKSSRKRSIQFVDAGEITAALEITNKIVQQIDEEECGEDGRISPYRSSTSSDATPTSITDELTNVPEPHEIQKLLKANCYGNEQQSNNEHSAEIPTPKAGKLENGFAKFKINESLVNGDSKQNLSANLNPSPNVALNGIKNDLNLDGTPVKGNSSLEARPRIVFSNGGSSDDASPSTSALAQTNGVRKRLLSERGEQESQYPRINNAAMFYNWDGFPLVNGKLAAAGLYNPMNNCFLNSVLQAVVHLPQLARMILDSRDHRMCTRVNNAQPDCFHCALKEHIQKAIKCQYPLHPHHWMNRFLRRIFPHHRTGVQEDAHEMLTLLLGALEPLPPKQTPNGLKMNGPMPSTPIEQIFGGNLRNQVICNVCKHVHTNYERIREINLGLTRTGCPFITELIEDFFKPEQLQNFLCSKCKKKNSATRHTTMLSSPVVLIIQLKRFNAYGGKNRTPVRIKNLLNMKPYTHKTDRNESDVIYKLYGIIEHIGGGLNFGHYVCAMRGFDGKGWFLFDDSDRRPIDEQYIATKMQPYILFYTKMYPGNDQLRRSYEGCQPKMAKQPRMANNGIGPYNNGTGVLNRTSFR